VILLAAAESCKKFVSLSICQILNVRHIVKLLMW